MTCRVLNKCPGCGNSMQYNLWMGWLYNPSQRLNIPHLVHKLVKSFVRERRFYNVRAIFFSAFLCLNSNKFENNINCVNIREKKKYVLRRIISINIKGKKISCSLLFIRLMIFLT